MASPSLRCDSGGADGAHLIFGWERPTSKASCHSYQVLSCCVAVTDSAPFFVLLYQTSPWVEPLVGGVVIKHFMPTYAWVAQSEEHRGCIIRSTHVHPHTHTCIFHIRCALHHRRVSQLRSLALNPHWKVFYNDNRFLCGVISYIWRNVCFHVSEHKLLHLESFPNSSLRNYLFFISRRKIT